MFSCSEEYKPIVLFFYQGKLVEGALHRERIDLDEILSEIRMAGYESFNQMKWIVLEPSGKISRIPYETEAHPRINTSAKTSQLS